MSEFAQLFTRIYNYSLEIVDGKIKACKKHKQACQRFLDDLEKAQDESYPYYFDYEELYNFYKWSSMFKHRVGILKGKKIDLVDFQQTLVQSTAITEQQKNTLVQKYIDMSNMIKGGMDKHYQDEYNSMQQFFQRSNALTDEEEKKALENLTKSNNDKKAQIDAYEQQIQSILQNAANNNRQITADEQQQINSIQENMKANAIRSLSENEIEAKVIMDRIKDYGSRITAEQASEIIKNAEKQRVESVDKANRQYEETKANIEHMRDDTHSITADQADKLIKDEEKQRKESVDKANELKEGVVKKIEDMNSDVEKNVDTSSGKILTGYDKLKKWWDNWHPLKKIFAFEFKQAEEGRPDPGKLWTGTNYWRGGITALHDTPGRQATYELYDLPRGTRVYNHDASVDLVTKTAENVAEKVANSVLNSFSGNSGGEQTIIVPVTLDGKEIAKVIAPYSDKIQGNNLRLAGRGIV